MPLPVGRNYGVFAGNVALQPGDYLLESSMDGITATAGGGITNSYQITSQTTRIAVVATIGDSVMLPPSAPGLELLIVNHGLNAMQVFGNGSDQVDDQVNSAGVAQMSNSMVIYTCATAGKWYTEGLASGFAASLGLQTFSYATIAANIANSQAAGTPITVMLTNLTATAAASATLPPSVPGLEMTVHNISAFIVLVFPSAAGTGTEKINSGAANAALSLPANTSTVFTCNVAGQWYSVPRVPS